MICKVCRQLGHEKEMVVEKSTLDQHKGIVWLRCDGVHPDPESTKDSNNNSIKNIHTPRVEEVSLDDYEQLEEV